MAIVKAASRRMGMDRSTLECERVALCGRLICPMPTLQEPGGAARGKVATHCFVWVAGVRVDERCVFGSAHMVGIFQPVTTFVLAIVAAKIAQYDATRPYSVWRGGAGAKCVRSCSEGVSAAISSASTSTTVYGSHGAR